MAELTWGQLADQFAIELAGAGCANAQTEARWLVQEVSGLHDAEWVVATGEGSTTLAATRAHHLLRRRLAGEPLQYVLGSWSFRAIELFVDPRVLIPRPETEQVVEVALGELDRLHRALRDAGEQRRVRVADLGTGSGAIALSVAAERDWTEVWATDASVDAVEVARANLAGIGSAGERVQLVSGSWFEALDPTLRGTLDMIVSNPPYVAQHEFEALDPSVREWEPAAALVPGPSGMEALEVLMRHAPSWLAAGGSLVLEIGADQGPAVLELARDAGFLEVKVRKDLAGRDRILTTR